MADNSILKSLTQLESDLRQINSAREQIETVSSAYDVLRGRVETFTDSVSGLSQNVKSLLSAISDERTNGLEQFDTSLQSLKTASSNLLSSFENECQKASSLFGERVTDCIQSMRSETELMHKEVTKIEQSRTIMDESVKLIRSLKDSTENLQNELKSSQSAQDDALNELSEKVQAVSANLNDTRTHFDNDVENLKTLLNDIGDNLQNIKSSILAGIQRMQNGIAEQFVKVQQQTDARIKTNKNLLIIAIVLLLGILIKMFI